MAHFRVLAKGGRGEVSRLGHKTTGAQTTVQSWDGQITTRMWWDEAEGVNRYEVTAEPHGGGQWDRKVLSHGIVGD